MTANPVHIGRILEHGNDWRWFRIDRSVSSSCPASMLRPGDVIRVRAVNEDAPFRTGECRVLDTFDDFVHVERGAWRDIIAIADMDHVYLTECGDRRRPYAPGEKLTDRHPDSVIAQVVEETIAKHCKSGVPSARIADAIVSDSLDRMVEHLTKPIERPPIDWAKLQKAPAQPGRKWVEPVEYRIGEDEMQTETPRVVTTCPGYNGVFHIEPDPPDLAQRRAARVAEHQRHEMQEQPARCQCQMRAMHLTKLVGGRYRCALCDLEIEEHCQPGWRPDGFDQRQLDAAKAALLAPAPPRYPRSR